MPLSFDGDMMRSMLFSLAVVLFGSCLDRINIDIPNNDLPIVVDGLITDEPGPYTVQITRALPLTADLNFIKPVSAKSVTIFDNVGNAEQLKEVEIGVYQTKTNGIRGVVGREYFIRIETRDGKVYESIPDKLNPVGKVDSVYYEFESFQPINEPTRYGFKVFADARGVPNGDNLFRWKFRATFELDGYPDSHTVGREGDPCSPAPRPCGGDGPGGSCTCCKCWATVSETQPTVSDNQFVSNGVFKKVHVGYAALEYFPFLIKYRLEVRQMSLSRTAFEYWKTIQSQKEGTASLFQPPTGKTRSNLFEKNGQTDIQGIFYAAAVKTKYAYIKNADVPIRLEVAKWNCVDGRIAEDCRLAYPFSTTEKPADWQ